MKRRPWQISEDEFLKNNFKDLTHKQIGERLGRTEGSVRRRAFLIGAVRNWFFSEVEIKFIIANYEKFGPKKIAEILGRSAISIRQAARQNNADIPKKITRYGIRNWTQQELDYVKENYKKIPIAEIEQKLQRTKFAITSAARKYNLIDKKQEYFMMQPEIIKTAREKIGIYLKDIREHRKLSLTQMKNITGLKFEQLKKIETGAGYNMDAFIKYIQALDCYFFLADKEGNHLVKDHMLKQSDNPI